MQDKHPTYYSIYLCGSVTVVLSHLVNGNLLPEPYETNIVLINE